MSGRCARLALHLGSQAIGLSLSRRQAGGRTLTDAMMAPDDSRDGQRLLGAIDRLMTSTQTPIEALEVIAFAAGPGGFSRVRVACAVAQGLALAAGCPVAPVNSLLAQAQACATSFNRLAKVKRRVVTLVDARMNEAYGASYLFAGEADEKAAITIQTEPFLAEAGEAVARLSDADDQSLETIISGDAWHRYGVSLTGGESMIAYEPTADEIATACLELSAQQVWASPAQAGPLYGREKVALNTAEQAALRERNARSARQP
ncbi:MAG: tRNA (adenosine(37)-N6)-threonylcarbamoyltransferase complex dimerization subunit type 1 TsaB [Burkholderiaceae bacterium]